MTDEDLDFLYEDLEPQESSVEKELREKNEALIEENASLLDRLQVLWTRHQERLEENRILSRNLSSLIKTARNEVNRKNATITELKKKLDDLIFKRCDGNAVVSSIVVDPKDLAPKLTIPPKMKPYKDGDLECCPPVSDLFLDASKGFHRITCGNSSVSFVRHKSMTEIKNRDIVYIRLDDGTFLGKKSLPSSNKDGGQRLILTPSEYKSLKRKRNAEVSNVPSKKMKSEYSSCNEDSSKKGSSELTSCRNASRSSSRNEKCEDSKRNEKHRYAKRSPEPSKREWKDKYANEVDNHRSTRDKGYYDRKSRRESKEEKSRDCRSHHNKKSSNCNQIDLKQKDNVSMDHEKKKGFLDESSRDNRNQQDKKLSKVTPSSDQTDSKQKRSVDHAMKKDNDSSRNRRNQSDLKIKESVTTNSGKRKECLTDDQVKTESNPPTSKTLAQNKKSLLVTDTQELKQKHLSSNYTAETQTEKKVWKKCSKIQETKGLKELPSHQSLIANSISSITPKKESVKPNNKCHSKNTDSSIKVENLERLSRSNNDGEQKESIKTAASKNSLYSLKRKKDDHHSKEIKERNIEKKPSLPSTASKLRGEKLLNKNVKNDSSETLKDQGIKLCTDSEPSLLKSNSKDYKKKALTVKRSNPVCNPREVISHNLTSTNSSLKADISSSKAKQDTNARVVSVQGDEIKELPPRISDPLNLLQTSCELKCEKDNDKENVLSSSSDPNSLNQTSVRNALLADLELSDSDEEDVLQALFHSEDATKPSIKESDSTSPEIPCGDDKPAYIKEKSPIQVEYVEPKKESGVLRNKKVSRKKLNAILFDGSDNEEVLQDMKLSESNSQQILDKSFSSNSDAATSFSTTVSIDASDHIHIPFQTSDVPFSKSLKRVNTEELENMVLSRQELMTRLIEEEKLCKDKLSQVYMISPVKYYEDNADSKEPGEISDEEEEGKEKESIYSTPVSGMSATPRSNDINFDSAAGIASILRDDLVRTAHISPSSGIISTPPSGAIGSTRKRNKMSNESTPVRRSPRKHPISVPTSTSKSGKKSDTSVKKSSAFARTSRYLFGDEDEEGGNRESKSNSKSSNKASRSKYRR